jgi:cellulase/cellobiase CelA1
VGSNENDWSYQGLYGPPDYDATSFAGMTPYIPIYDDGKRLWGEEPSEDSTLPDIPIPDPDDTDIPALEEDDYLINYKILNDWGTGASIEVAITNTSSTDINGWTLEWTFSGNQEIVHLWNAAYTQSGASITVQSISYTNIISANGGQVVFGFNMNYTGTNEIPDNFVLMGAAENVQ